MDNKKLSKTLYEFVAMFLTGDYKAIERLTSGIRLTKAEIETAVKEYPRTIIVPPESVFENIDIIEVSGSKPKQWNVYFHLWTAEEGRSDLTLELTLIDNNKQTYEVQLDDIHVL
jgi:hypothetical protein